MAYAPLFHELHSSLFLELCRITNELKKGARPTRKELLDRLLRLENMDLSDWSSQKRLDSLLKTLFPSETDGAAELFLEKSVPFRATSCELRWLKTMLEDEAAAFLLDKPLRQELRERLADVPPLPREKWTVQCDKGDAALSLQGLLAEFWSALRRGRMVSYINMDGKGQRHEQAAAAPCRLEYDAAANRYRAIFWISEDPRSPGENGRAVKVNFSNLEDLQCLEEAAPADTEEKFLAFLAKRRRQCRLQLLKKNNAVNRAFRLFAPYDKEASYDEANDAYALTVHYYSFDYEDIRRKILSLGSAAIVLAPQGLRQDIMNTLLTQWQRLQAEHATKAAP